MALPLTARAAGAQAAAPAEEAARSAELAAQPSNPKPDRGGFGPRSRAQNENAAFSPSDVPSKRSSDENSWK
jgi:hypothetical protein